MRCFFLRSSLLASLTVILLWIGGMDCVSSQENQLITLNEENGSSAEVTHVFSAVPPGGYTGVSVTVTNKGNEEITVKATTESTTPAGNGEHLLSGPPRVMVCKAQATITREFIVPLMTKFASRRSYEDVSLLVSMTQGGRPFGATFSSRPLEGFPFWAVSQSIGGPGASDLNEAARKKVGTSTSSYRSEEKFAASFLAAQLPGDWRAYTGFDGMALTPEEWSALLPGVRTAIRQWIMLGGVLDLYHTGPAPEGVLHEIKTVVGKNGRAALGEGFVRLVSWNGVLLGENGLSQFESSGEVAARLAVAQEAMEKGDVANPGAGLPQALGVRSFAAWQVGIILLIFGILVGPVNLFYLAAPGRRHRLFFTTPIIALVASVVLIVVIFLQDGAGGMGQRAALMELHPDENLSVVRQYQISRTGVLFGGGFVMEEPAVLTPLLLEPSRWTRLKPGDTGESEGQRFDVLEPQSYAGDWFQSRSEQAQLVETLRPGRGRVELKPGSNPPIVTSSLTGSLEQIFYQDSAEQWWCGNGVLATGGSFALQKASEADFEGWLQKQSKPFPAKVRLRLKTSPHTGRFYAVSHDPRIGFAGTLASIHWQQDHALVYGRLAPLP